jgi:sulfate adenylyltransferase subunit 2|tara:strand:- start:2599 stop:3498 length:900 start_codon:yes stop_codon:yes gene_type:complete
MNKAHLKNLESESIFILREAFSESNNPVMLYSLGKDSSVLLHLAMKAFFPGPIPFPVLHIDTRWKFKEMYKFRDKVKKKYKLNLIKYINPIGIKRDISPLKHGSETHTRIMKTEALKLALDSFEFDLAFGGARRDEEKSRAKERIFSFRSSNHIWDPKNQRPELWNIFNARKKEDQTIRVFPLSNWTELDIWEYIKSEGIDVVPLYFSKPRKVIKREGTLIMLDDERLKLKKNEEIKILEVRFRTLGCYPLTGAIESKARNLNEIIKELKSSRFSERQGRLIDSDSNSSMESKKKEGYF